MFTKVDIGKNLPFISPFIKTTSTSTLHVNYLHNKNKLLKFAVSAVCLHLLKLHLKSITKNR